MVLDELKQFFLVFLVSDREDHYNSYLRDTDKQENPPQDKVLTRRCVLKRCGDRQHQVIFSRHTVTLEVLKLPITCIIDNQV